MDSAGTNVRLVRAVRVEFVNVVGAAMLTLGVGWMGLAGALLAPNVAMVFWFVCK